MAIVSRGHLRLDLKYEYVKNYVAKGLTKVEEVPDVENPADGFTKTLSTGINATNNILIRAEV